MFTFHFITFHCVHCFYVIHVLQVFTHWMSRCSTVTFKLLVEASLGLPLLLPHIFLLFVFCFLHLSLFDAKASKVRIRGTCIVILFFCIIFMRKERSPPALHALKSLDTKLTTANGH